MTMSHRGLGFCLFLVAGCGNSSTSSPAVSAIALSPSPCAVSRSNSVQMHAMATLPDGTKKDVTSLAKWSSGNTQTLTVDQGGTIVGVNTGITAVTAEYEKANGTLDCTVSP